MDLDLTYHGREIPEAYEVLLLDALKGDEARSVRGDELDASWKIWTPLLHYLDDDSAGVRPREYAYGEYISNNNTFLNQNHNTSNRFSFLSLFKCTCMQANRQHTGSHGPEGLEEFIASHQRDSSEGSKQRNNMGKSFREDVSQTGTSSLTTNAKDEPP